MKYFYQDFLFGNIPLTPNEMPSVQPDVIKVNAIPLPIEGPFPPEEGYTLSLSNLMQIKSNKAWIEIMHKCSKYQIIYLIDDVAIVNDEMAMFKEIFIKTYYWHLSNQCHKVKLAVY